MNIEIFYFSGCPSHLPTVSRVREALENEGVLAKPTEIEVSDTGAERLGFLGSPTIRIDGLDIEQKARGSREVGWMCRTYTHCGQREGVPPTELIQAAIREAKTNKSSEPRGV